MTDDITGPLVDFALDTRWEDMEARTREAAKLTTANVLALAIASAAHPAVDRTVAALNGLTAGEAVAVLGRDERLPPQWAALVHGVAAHAEDFDDTHRPTVVHPGSPVVPAALAAAQMNGADGRSLLTAVAVGAEVALRLGTALTPHSMTRGWHMTGVVGGVGAAVAAGRVLGLGHGQLRHAIGFAATQTSGLLEALGTLTKPLHAGKAASQGVEAALLARAGLDGPAAPLEGRRGLLTLLRPGQDGPSDRDAALLTEGLGTTWELESNEVKPYACGVVGHPIVDLARELRPRLPDAAAITEVELTVHPLVPAVLGQTEPADGLQSKFSAAHCFATGLVRGSGGTEDFSDAAAADPALAALRPRCRLVADGKLGRYAVRARVNTEDGRVVEHSVDGARRLDAAGVHAKAAALVTPVLGGEHAAFLGAAFGMEDLAEAAAVIRAGRVAPARP